MPWNEWLGVLGLCLLIGLCSGLGWLAEAFFEAGPRPGSEDPGASP